MENTEILEGEGMPTSTEVSAAEYYNSLKSEWAIGGEGQYPFLIKQDNPRYMLGEDNDLGISVAKFIEGSKA